MHMGADGGLPRRNGSGEQRTHLTGDSMQTQCQKFGIELQAIPDLVGRPSATPPQLVDEYYWATITRGVEVPPKEQLATWLEWMGKSNE